MFGDNNENKDLIFVNIRNGFFTIKASSPNEKRFGKTAVTRTYKEDDGNEKTIYEFQAKTLDGVLSAVKIRDTNFGTVISLNIDDGNYMFGISASTNSNYGRSIMEKLPNLHLGDKIKLRVYDDFTTKEGKKKYAGVSVINLDSGNKIYDAFYDFENKKRILGYPEFPKDYENYDKDDWKIHFLKVEKFLKNYIKENVESKFNRSDESNNDLPIEDTPDSPPEVEEDDLPF